MSDPTTYTRYAQAEAVAHTGFRGLVKASVMVTAYQVLRDTDNPNYEQRAGLSRTLLFAGTPPETIDAIVTLFCWWAVNVPAVQNESYAGGNGFQPQQISDQTIDAAVLAFWDDASAVRPENEQEG